jgi:hypothetical protein
VEEEEGAEGSISPMVATAEAIQFARESMGVRERGD